ncbi:MAG: M28 family peptidase [Armatimonadota bacterium]|nr:MAG: M28 family peptidase [Armatimonadota bacterium]
MFQDLLTLLGPQLDGHRSFDDASAIHSLDRHFTFSSFHESARLTADRLRAAGLSSVEVLEAPADGRTIFGDWMMPLAWEADEATFDILVPEHRAERIADRAAIPASLAMWSAPTPPKGVEAELIYIEDPADRKTWTPETVRGKIVFTSAHPHSVKRLLLEQGALGILSDHQPRDADLPDAVAWVNAWSDDPGGWAQTNRDVLGWSFQISPRRGAQLRGQLETQEQLRARAVVRSSLHAGSIPTPTGVIPGAGKEEILILGHQFEQGAVDNASGCAIMLEAARALQALISEGKLPPPRRTIRFLFVSECYTTLFWANRASRARRTVAGLCIDAPCGVMDLALRPLEISVNPHSQPTCVDALLLAIAREVMAAAPTYPWAERPFAMGTDNLIADNTIGIPCPWIGSHSRTWHSSADTPEVLDPRSQELVARIAAAYAYLLATADHNSVLDFAHLAAARGKAALAAAGITELDRLPESDLNDSLLQLAYLAEHHAQAPPTALKLLPAPERSHLRPQIRALQREVRRAGRDEAAGLARRAGRPGHSPLPHEPAGVLATIHPRRLVTGPITFDRVDPDQRQGRQGPRWSPALFALLNWCNGRRSLAEASHSAARELRTTHTLSPDEFVKQIDPRSPSMLDYFEFLRRHNYVTW